MNDNVGYLTLVTTSTFSGIPVADDHIYEELPSDHARKTSMAVLKNEQDLDDSSHPKGAEQPSGSLHGDEDDYYVNDDFFPEEYRTENISEKTAVKKAKEGVDDMFSDEANCTANAVTTT